MIFYPAFFKFMVKIHFLRPTIIFCVFVFYHVFECAGEHSYLPETRGSDQEPRFFCFFDFFLL